MSTRPNTPGKHVNDIYGDLDNPAKETRPATPAATVVLLRDADAGPEVLMLRKNSKIAFGGMWVFPGGRIDPEDYPTDGDRDAAARNAAAREAAEEAGVTLDANEFIWFAHWTPPPSTPVRFATWFFAARASDEAIDIDGGEIEDHRWIRPADALAKHAEGEIDLVPPTWVTLHHLSLYQPVDAARGVGFAGRPLLRDPRRQACRWRARCAVGWRRRLRGLGRRPGRTPAPPSNAGTGLHFRERRRRLLIRRAAINAVRDALVPSRCPGTEHVHRGRP